MAIFIRIALALFYDVKFLDSWPELLAAGILLWPNESAAGLESNRYRAIVECPNAAATIERFERAGVRAIVPIHDWELIDNAEKFPRAASLSRRTISLPTYPLMTSAEVLKVIQAFT